MRPPTGILRLAIVLTTIIITSISLRADWSPPERLTSNNGEDRTTGGSLSIDGNDVLHLTWLYDDPSTGQAHVMVMENPGTGWGSALDLTPAGGSYFEIDTAVHPNGTLHIVVQEGSSMNSEIVYASDRDGSFRFERVTDNSWEDLTPAVAVDGYGRPHVAWTGYDPSSGTGKIHYAYRSLGGTWIMDVIEESRLGSFWTGATPRIAVSQTGIPYITYRGGNYGNYDVRFATKSGDTWTDRSIPTPNWDDYDTSILTEADGTIHLAASGNDGWGFPYRIYYNTSMDGGTSWEGWELATGTYGATTPVLAVDPLEGPHIVWAEISGNFLLGTSYHSTMQE